VENRFVDLEQNAKLGRKPRTHSADAEDSGFLVYWLCRIVQSITEIATKFTSERREFYKEAVNSPPRFPNGYWRGENREGIK
jgi:hypothetical protein